MGYPFKYGHWSIICPKFNWSEAYIVIIPGIEYIIYCLALYNLTSMV